MPQLRLHRNPAARQAAYRRRQSDALLQQQRAKGLPAMPAVPTIPGTARWTAATEMAARLLSDVADEMEAYYDDRSEEWQQDQRGETHQERIDTLQEVVGNLNDIWY